MKNHNYLPDYDDTIGLAKLSILIYEYQKCFKLNKHQQLEDFVSNNKDMKNIPLKCRNILNELNKDTPHGTVIDFISDELTDIQVGIAKSDKNKRICIIFRGSESIKDWIYDLTVLKTKLRDNIHVHKGFYKQLYENDVYNILENKIGKLISLYPDYEFYVTGHSLGAALATLCGFQLADKFNNNNFTVISFASPRVGDYNFKIACEEKDNLSNYRICNSRDFITSVPCINFYHTGIALSLKSDYITVFIDGDSFGWLEFSPFTSWNIFEHNMYLYHDRLLKNKW